MKGILLLAAKWLMTTTSIQLGIGVVIIGSSLFASYQTDQWHWFQRSGALLVSIGAILSTRRLLRSGLEGLIHGDSASEIIAAIEKHRAQTEDTEAKQDLMSAYIGFVVVGLGTVIWAYGDLVGCLVDMDMQCLS